MYKCWEHSSQTFRALRYVILHKFFVKLNLSVEKHLKSQRKNASDGMKNEERNLPGRYASPDFSSEVNKAFKGKHKGLKYEKSPDKPDNLLLDLFDFLFSLLLWLSLHSGIYSGQHNLH